MSREPIPDRAPLDYAARGFDAGPPRHDPKGCGVTCAVLLSAIVAAGVLALVIGWPS